jgi:hypothetical protein
MKNQPNITKELVLWLEQTFTPVTDTRNVDLREIDFKSGQYSVVTHLKAMAERQKNYGGTEYPKQGSD